jgi:hypothetical protein
VLTVASLAEVLEAMGPAPPNKAMELTRA